jgi:single-stranded-DNA-specific exonuclease
MTVKRWQIAPLAPLTYLKQYRDMPPILAQILYNRGFQEPQDAYHFLYDNKLAEVGGNPFVMKDMDKAVMRITQAIKRKETIVVYGDFDADGVTSTALMMHVLRRLKAKARAYIPHRVDEGYGLNSEALRQIAKDGAKLVITVDCGIRSVQEIEDGKAAGLDIIVTDHHSVGPEIPLAYAVVNPQQDDCDGNTALAGVGVAFMVARGLLLKAWLRNGRKDEHRKIYEQLVTDLLDLVAIGTVADIMPLNDPLNRVLVRQGLDVINAARRPGVRSLMKVAGVHPGEITAMNIGFALGPRINAAGRLETAMHAYNLMAARSDDEALSYAETLQELNLKRQKLTREAHERIQQQVEAEGQHESHLIFAADDNVAPGIVGLVAGRLTEQYYRPAVILDSGPEESHASCRSIPEFHITQALDECADLLVRHGGHAMAAGLTVRNENIPQLRERLHALADAALRDTELVPVLDVDMEIDLGQIDMRLIEDLKALEPTGHKNKPPIFASRGLQVKECRTVGSDKSHLKLKLGTDGIPPVEAIGFRLGAWAQDIPECLDVAYHLEINEYQRRRNVQMNLLDIQVPGEG